MTSGVYQEGGRFTHDGRLYDMDNILRSAHRIPVESYPVSELKWVLGHDRRDPSRLRSADLNAPVLLARSENGKMAVVDGQHRLQKAVNERVSHLPAKVLTDVELLAGAVNTKSASDESKASLSREDIKKLVDKEMSGLHYGDYPLDRNVARYNAYVQHHHDAVNKARPEIVARAKKSRSLWKKLTLQKPGAQSYELTPDEKKRFPHVKSMTPTTTTFDRDFRPDGHWKTAMTRELLHAIAKRSGGSGSRDILEAAVKHPGSKSAQGVLRDPGHLLEGARKHIFRPPNPKKRGANFARSDGKGGKKVISGGQQKLVSFNRLRGDVARAADFSKTGMVEVELQKLGDLTKTAGTYQVNSVKDELDRLIAEHEVTRQANNRRGRERMQRESR